MKKNQNESIDTPRLSIIIPCYNYARYLPYALESLFHQEYRDYELILVNDGSTDGSGALMEIYRTRHPHVQILHHPTHQGLFRANATGWAAARGQYLHFFSADDLYRSEFLPRAMALFAAQPHLGLICSDIGYFQEGSAALEEKKLWRVATESTVFSALELISLFQRNFWVPGLSCIVKNSLLKAYSCSECHLDPTLENLSDWFCFHKIALFEGIGYIPQIGVTMRLHAETYTSRVKRDKRRRRSVYNNLLARLRREPETENLFKQAGLLSFVFRELYWQLRFHPHYLGFWKYMKL